MSPGCAAVGVDAGTVIEEIDWRLLVVQRSRRAHSEFPRHHPRLPRSAVNQRLHARKIRMLSTQSLFVFMFAGYDVGNR